MSQQKKGFYHGWLIVVTCFITMALVYAPAVLLTGQLLGPLAVEFGMSMTAVNSVVTLSMLAAMVGSALAGKTLMKFGVRKIASIALLIVALGYVGCASVTNIVMLYIVNSIRGFAATFATMIPASIMVNTWFGPKMKGRAMALTTVGTSIGGMILSPVLAAVVENFGWRKGYLFFAAMAVVALIFVFLTFSATPASKGVARMGDDPNAAQAAGGKVSGLTTKQGLRSAMFWLLILGFLCLAGSTQCWSTNAPSFYSSVGVSAVLSGTLISVTALTSAIGQLLAGTLCDKRGARVGITVFGGCLALAYILASVAAAGSVSWMTILCAVLIGLGMSIVNVVMPTAVGDLFGNREFGTFIGFGQVGQSLGCAIVPLVASSFFDSTGSYAPMFGVCAVFAIFAIVLIWLSYARRKSTYAKLGE